MSAHHLAFRKYRPDALPANNAIEIFGPVAELIWLFQEFRWPSHPYEVQPEWTKGRIWPDELPGVSAHTDEFNRRVEELTQ